MIYKSTFKQTSTLFLEYFFYYTNKIILLLVFGKISSSFNDAGHPLGHALDRQPDVPNLLNLELPEMLWINCRFAFFIQIHQFLLALYLQPYFLLSVCQMKKKTEKNFF